MTEPLCDLP